MCVSTQTALTLQPCLSASSSSLSNGLPTARTMGLIGPLLRGALDYQPLTEAHPRLPTSPPALPTLSMYLRGLESLCEWCLLCEGRSCWPQGTRLRVLCQPHLPSHPYASHSMATALEDSPGSCNKGSRERIKKQTAGGGAE